jgi:hypothetical protein
MSNEYFDSNDENEYFEDFGAEDPRVIREKQQLQTRRQHYQLQTTTSSNYINSKQ